LRIRLQDHYLEKRNCSENAFRKYLARCRKLKKLRDVGLQYVVFCPALVQSLEKDASNSFEAWETAQRGVFLKVDKLVGIHCPDWLRKVEELFPSKKIGACLNENGCAPHSHLPRGAGDKMRYDNLSQ